MGKLESAEMFPAFFLTLPLKVQEGKLLNCNFAAVVPLDTCYLLHVNAVALHLENNYPARLNSHGTELLFCSLSN